MISWLLEFLGLSAGQAGIGMMLIVGAIWARRALLAGELVATGIRFGSVVAGVVGVGIVFGVISIDFSILGAVVGRVLEFVKDLVFTPPRFLKSAFERVLERV